MKKAVLMAAGCWRRSRARTWPRPGSDRRALNERDVEATLRLIDAAAVGRAVVKEMG